MPVKPIRTYVSQRSRAAVRSVAVHDGASSAGVCCDCGCGVRCEDHAGCDGAGCDGAGCDGAGCDVTYVFPWMNTCELQLRCRVVILLTECAALLC